MVMMMISSMQQLYFHMYKWALAELSIRTKFNLFYASQIPDEDENMENKKKSNKKYEYENAHIKERKKMESNTRIERKNTSNREKTTATKNSRKSHKT